MATGNVSLRQSAARLLEDFRESPQSIGYLWRLDLSRILIERMEEKRWTQKQLADETEMQQPFVSRIMNADSNCTFDVAGRLLFALGFREGDVVLMQRPQITFGRTEGDPLARIGQIAKTPYSEPLRGTTDVQEEEFHGFQTEAAPGNKGVVFAGASNDREPYAAHMG